MKFGKTLLNNQIPEWSKNYLTYKALKKSIKEAALQLPPTEEATTAIFFQLDRELEKVNTFYTYKQSQINRRLWILSEKYHQCYSPSDDRDPSGDVDNAACVDNYEELVNALKETRAQMNKIMWFAELNAKGFRKILKKLDKKLGLETQTVYWQTKVAVLPFASHLDLRLEIDRLSDWIAKLTATRDRLPKTEKVLVNGSANGPTLVSLHPSLSRNNLLIEKENADITPLLENDDADKLAAVLNSGELTEFKGALDEHQFKYALLELSLQRGSVCCLEYLISIGVNPLGQRDINERNLLHKLAIKHRESELKPKVLEAVRKLIKLVPELPKEIDFMGRRPLHYACEFEQPEYASILMQHAVEQSYYGKDGFKDSFWQDREGHTPFFLAIIHGSHKTLSVLVQLGKIDNIDEVLAAASNKTGETNGDADAIPDFARSIHHPSAVAMACSISNLDLLQLLLQHGASVDLADDDGETAMLIAIRNHFTEGVRALIQRHANVNLPEKLNKWTPLMVTAIEGHKDIAELLLEAGADRTATDNGGWAAYEHAVFRGHLDIGRLIKPDKIEPMPENWAHTSLVNGDDKQNNFISKTRSSAGRLYGHKYLTDQSMIIITLGSNDIRNPLSRRFISFTESSFDEQRLSVSVSAVNATGTVPIIDLPPSNQHTPFHPEPIVLFTSKPEEVVLKFDVVETFGSTPSESTLARGTALFAGDQIFTKSRGFKGHAAGNMSLRGQQTVPLIGSSSLEYVGSLGFEYFIVTPFSHPKMTVGDRYTYYKSVDTKVIGHRGSGMNKKAARLQVGENTVLSFITAASLGAEYVEFDVQLTKDLVPVIYHDWTVTETGYDIPLNAITVEQFLNLRPSGHIKEYHTGVSDGPKGQLISTSKEKDEADELPALAAASFEESLAPLSPSASQPTKRVNRSHSMSAIRGSQMHGRHLLSGRMELTRTKKLGKMKGNGPESIQAPFTTLKEALKKIPKSAGCNIEIKYPMVDEAEGDELHQFQEVNIFVDTILECVYDHAEQDRKIIFSSFHPEICLALNLKQPNYPVFFLTDAGTLPMADIRCNSLQGAMRFAKQADLLGIVSASEPVLQAPRMVRVIKESGLLLFTYGVLNNEVENAIAQKKYGVDAVIVDSVLAVRKGLHGDTTPPSKD